MYNNLFRKTSSGTKSLIIELTSCEGQKRRICRIMKFIQLKTYYEPRNFSPVLSQFGVHPAPGYQAGRNTPQSFYPMAETTPLQPSKSQPVSDLDLERTVQDVLCSAGLEIQIEEFVEAIVLLMEQADKFKTIGIKPAAKGFSDVWIFCCVTFSFSFWLPTHIHQDPGKPFLRVHALPRQKHITWNLLALRW